MNLAVLADEIMKQEFLSKGIPGDVEINFCDSIKTLTMLEADAYFDLQFRMDAERTRQLSAIKGKPVFISSVAHTCSEVGQQFTRINAWPGFLPRPIIEIAIAGKQMDEQVAGIFEKLKWKQVVVPDQPGFITARIVAMIINEAFYALGEGVSDRAAIDTAMKLGTNYPYGPFEWAGKIGQKNIYELLNVLSRENSRYEPAPNLKN